MVVNGQPLCASKIVKFWMPFPSAKLIGLIRRASLLIDLGAGYIFHNWPFRQEFSTLVINLQPAIQLKFRSSVYFRDRLYVWRKCRSLLAFFRARRSCADNLSRQWSAFPSDRRILGIPGKNLRLMKIQWTDCPHRFLRVLESGVIWADRFSSFHFEMSVLTRRS